MNVFPLHEDKNISASMNVDAHIQKIILESVQMLCAVNLENNLPTPYKVSKAQFNHPLIKWVRYSFSNYLWVVDNVYALHEEWRYRYKHASDKKHKSLEVFETMETPYLMNDFGLTPIPKSMRTEFQVDDEPNILIPIRSYKKYYLGAKRHLYKWKEREIPQFISDNIY